MIELPAITVPGEIMVQGVRLGFLDLMRDADMRDRLAKAMAETQRSELMTTAEAAELLRTTPKTLLANHVEWQLDKSIALGADNPRFYRSQIRERMAAKEIKGRKAPEKVTTFPSNPHHSAQSAPLQKAS